jgi:hypothetical protein
MADMDYFSRYYGRARCKLVIEGHDPEIEKKQLSRARTVKNPEIKN